MTKAAATLIGLSAIVMWSALATLTVATGPIPPLQLAAMTFAIGALVGPASWLIRGVRPSLRGVPAIAWLVGVGGLFGYHALYFIALRLAPPAEAGLLNYLWPLLIVLLSGLLPGERLRVHHIAGALLGLTGTAVLFGGGGAITGTAPITGLVAASLAAFVWAGYSVLSRRFAGVPTDAVAGFCLATAALAALAHVMFEATVWPRTLPQWTAIAVLGLGPVGAAFYTWDIGMKRGDIRVLGAASYATPLISTGLLIAAGYANATATLAAAAALIALGGLIAARDMIGARSRSSSYAENERRNPSRPSGTD
jgi:drug/metabolite transporter (DMT)-like permease